MTPALERGTDQGDQRDPAYLSPDSTTSTRRLGSSVRRAARTQPAVPAGGCCRLGGQGGDGERLASSYDDNVVLGVEQLSGVGVGRDTLEVLEEGRFLKGEFCGPEDKEGGDDGGEDEMRVFRGGHGVCSVRVSGCAVLRLYFRGQQLDTVCPCCSALLVFCISSPTLWNDPR